MRTRRLLALVCAAGMVLGPMGVVGPAEAKPSHATHGKAGHHHGHGHGHGHGRHHKRSKGKPVTVMTRNIYLGGDINRPVNAALAAAAQPGANLLTIATALGNAAHETWQYVEATDFTVRGRLLAEEIADARPDLVGLQEVALWRHGPMEIGAVGVPNAETVDYDFLQILLDELAAQGTPYVAASVADRADVESPSFSGSILAPGEAKDVRLTMRDVILMRDSGSLTPLAEDQSLFDHNLSVGLAGVTFNFDRGYQWIDVRAGSKEFRFVNTHLESVSSDLALAQANQVLAEATSPDLSTVFVCDCNSDPVNGSVKPTDTVPHKAPYELITSTGGYTDLWKASGRPTDLPGFDAGDTAGLNESVDEPLPGSWTHRIDMVFGRTSDGDALSTDRGRVTGRDGDPRDPATGLWPSDHAGVVMRVRGL